jgi:HD-like signal output (HDOD) protein
MKIYELIQDPRSSVEDITEVLKSDPGLTARILRLVNSSFYSIPGGVQDVPKAVQYLGFNTLSQISLGVSVFSAFSRTQGSVLNLNQFWKHSLATGVVAQAIAQDLGMKRPEESFTHGLLHDLGKVVIFELEPKLFNQMIESAKSKKSSFAEIEVGHWPKHAEVGFAVSKAWGLPKSLQTVILHHHTPIESLPVMSADLNRQLQILKLADALVLSQKWGESGNYSLVQAPDSLFSQLGFSQQRFKNLQSKLSDEIERVGAILNVHG